MGGKHQAKPKLLIPHYPKDDEGLPYEIYTLDLKIISDYSRLTFEQIYELDIVDYQTLLRDAFIHGKYQTEEGIEYLRDCKTLTETEADVKGLREQFGKG